MVQKKANLINYSGCSWKECNFLVQYFINAESLKLFNHFVLIFYSFIIIIIIIWSSCMGK